MSNVFKTFLIPPAQKAIADLICNDLGYPEKGMFVAEMLDTTGTTVQGYISTGIVDDGSPLLANDSQDMLDMIQERNPASTVTLPDCAEFIEYLDLTVDDPFQRMDFMRSELNGVPVQQAWVRPTVNEPGYPLDALVSRAGRIWRNLIPNNHEQPAIGRNGWRSVWSP